MCLLLLSWLAQPRDKMTVKPLFVMYVG